MVNVALYTIMYIRVKKRNAGTVWQHKDVQYSDLPEHLELIHLCFQKHSHEQPVTSSVMLTAEQQCCPFPL